MKYTFHTLIFILLFCSCGNRNKKEVQTIQTGEITAQELQTIHVKVENSSFEKLGDYLKAASYVQLPHEPLIGNVREIQIKNERIYLQDNLSRILCYDMQGNLAFKIDSQGNGPGEYAQIDAFAVNEDKRELALYDNMQQKLLFYNSDYGKFVRAERLTKPNPTAMAATEGTYFYSHPYHNNYPADTLLHYSLLASRNGTDITKHYFVHDAAESDYHFNVTPQPFSYNDSTLYYCRNFDNIVYEVSPDRLKAIYRIETPNPIPASKIAGKADEQELIESHYSMGIENVYRCGNLLYFQFSQSGFLQVALYDLSKKEQIYCGRRLADKSGKAVPIHRLINGVYKNRFWGYLTPETIGWALNNEAKDYPDIFRNYNPEEDNLVIVFYETVN